MATVLELLDNAVGDESLLRMPGPRLLELAEHVHRFADSYPAPLIDEEQQSVYLGGWPSANFWLASFSELVMSSMLYSGQVLVRDPVADWFAPERYEVDVLLGSRGGFLDERLEPDLIRTRQFLSVVVPELRRLRPLIESGVIVLAPYRKFRAIHAADVGELADLLSDRVMDSPEAFASQFRPEDLAIEDNLRGAFVFAGGERDAQVQAKARQALQYFASEYLFAENHGVTYTAPYPFEEHVCRTGLDHVLATPSERVLSALLRSDLPAFSGLTPELLASVREDESFAGFREVLFTAYRDLPLGGSQRDIDAYMADVEATLLVPRLKAAEREVDRGTLSNVLRIAGFGTRVGLSVLAGASVSPGLPAQTGAAIATEAGFGLVGRLRSRRATPAIEPVWRLLAGHGRRPHREISHARVDPGNATERRYWGIPAEPSMGVTVTSGELILDTLPKFDLPSEPGGPKRRNSSCGCGSGLKWKFCCGST